MAQTTQTSLRELGLEAVVTEQGENMRITSSIGDARFAFVLASVRTEKQESTRVRLEWEKNPDPRNGQRIMQLLTQLEVNSVRLEPSAQK